MLCGSVVEKLVLKYRFDSPGAVAARGSGHVIVERRVTDHGDDRWQRVPEEEARCARYIRAEPREVELSLPDPVHGLRYTPVFQLAQAGPTPDYRRDTSRQNHPRARSKRDRSCRGGGEHWRAECALNPDFHTVIRTAAAERPGWQANGGLAVARRTLGVVGDDLA